MSRGRSAGLGILAGLGLALARRRRGLIPFRILARHVALLEKLSYDVEVDLVDGRHPTLDQCRAIARVLDDRRYRRFFCGFFLPGMDTREGAYARCNRSPEMGVDEALVTETYRGMMRLPE